MLASFVPIFASGDHMVTCHISETTLYTVIKFRICSPPVLLAMYVYEVL